MSDLLTATDLEAAKKHDTFHSEVITGKAGGVAGGANIDTATNAVTGQVQKTLPKVLEEIAGNHLGDWPGAGDPPVTLTNVAQTLRWQVADGGDGHDYAWTGALPKIVSAGSTPTPLGAGGWIDRSDVTLRGELVTGFNGIFRRIATLGDVSSGAFPPGVKLSIVERGCAPFDVVSGGTPNGYNVLDAGNGNTAVVSISGNIIDAQHWGVVSDYVSPLVCTDNISALAAITDYINNIKAEDSFTILISGAIATSDSLIINGGGTYDERSVSLKSKNGRATLVKIGATSTAPTHGVIYLKKPTTPGAFACCNVSVDGVLLQSTTADYGITSGDQVTFCKFNDINMILGKAGSQGYFFSDFFYINEVTKGKLECAGKAFNNTKSGTTNYIDGLFAYGCQGGAYHFQMVYSKIGALAADMCVGIIYDFTNSQISAGSLGCESPGASIVVRATSASSISVGEIFITSLLTTSTFTVIEVRTSSCVVSDNVTGYVSTETSTIMLNGKLINCPHTFCHVEVGRVSGFYIYGVEDNISQQSSASIGELSGEMLNKREAGIISIGGGRTSNPNWYNNGISRPAKTIFLNHGVGHNTLVDGSSVQFQGPGMKAGDIVILNNAASSGIAAEMVLTAGSDFSSSTYGNIPIVFTVANTASLPSTYLWQGRKVNVVDIKKTLTYFSSPAGWYDESGAKLA